MLAAFQDQPVGSDAHTKLRGYSPSCRGGHPNEHCPAPSSAISEAGTQFHGPVQDAGLFVAAHPAALCSTIGPEFCSYAGLHNVQKRQS